MRTTFLRLVISFGLLAGFGSSAYGACEEQLQQKYDSLALKLERLPTHHLGMIMGLDDYRSLGGTMLTDEEIQVQKDHNKGEIEEIRMELALLKKEHRCKATDPVMAFYAGNKCRLKLAKRNKDLRSLTHQYFATGSQFKGYEQAMNFMANRDEGLRRVLLNTLAGVRSFARERILENQQEILDITRQCEE